MKKRVIILNDEEYKKYRSLDGYKVIVNKDGYIFHGIFNFYDKCIYGNFGGKFIDRKLDLIKVKEIR